MDKRIRQVVVFIHGVGNQDPAYSHGCKDHIFKEFRKHTKVDSSTDIDSILTFKEVLWSNVTSEKQAELIGRVTQEEKLGWMSLRKFFVSFAGDAIASQKGDNWEKIKKKIDTAILEVKKEFPNGSYEFTFVAHSLGTVLISDYLVNPKCEVTKEEVVNIFTLGSPIAVWSLINGWPSAAPDVFEVDKQIGTWINIMDADDIIAYPLRNVSSKYHRSVCLDYLTEIGGLIDQRTPLCHTKYWTDENVVKPIAKKLIIDFNRINNGEKYARNEYLSYIKKLRNN